eukprot:scaffold4062_cov131-Isochrysis_galbana.AAC.3
MGYVGCGGPASRGCPMWTCSSMASTLISSLLHMEVECSVAESSPSSRDSPPTRAERRIGIVSALADSESGVRGPRNTSPLGVKSSVGECLVGRHASGRAVKRCACVGVRHVGSVGLSVFRHHRLGGRSSFT